MFFRVNSKLILRLVVIYFTKLLFARVDYRVVVLDSCEFNFIHSTKANCGDFIHYLIIYFSNLTDKFVRRNNRNLNVVILMRISFTIVAHIIINIIN